MQHSMMAVTDQHASVVCRPSQPPPPFSAVVPNAHSPSHGDSSRSNEQVLVERGILELAAFNTMATCPQTGLATLLVV